MTASKSFNNHPKHKALYHALMDSILTDEDAMDQGVADFDKQKKRNPSVQLEETVFKAADSEMPLNQGDDIGNTNAQPDVEAATKDDYCVELEYNIEECYHALSDQLDWNNPKGNHCPYDLSKPLPLQEIQGRLTVSADFFFTNDLEYLRGGSTDRKYRASTTTKKAAKYDVEGIEDMVPNLWSPIKVAYDKHAA
ncbi:hypothetical protein Tco_0097504 [Tanacetum coccineum]